MKTGIVVWYESNKTQIAAEFCVNKDNPDMECNGQCHMKKQLNKVEVSLTFNTKKNEPPRAPIQKLKLSPFILETQKKSEVKDVFTQLQINRFEEKALTGYLTITPPPPKDEIA